ncbi:ELO family [Protomyces lactucae-debilis]|uniref:Elongation of fatty acids protein n=1 Tax=Protomyces lactucae-debilis TaxID=2754530 RepID=A0A1Y2FX90_PROLT|nr:ELO family [Protomyces lactucae-debilis]ORY87796.1 ELO family [Protomyces lactucae-debilis]
MGFSFDQYFTSGGAVNWQAVKDLTYEWKFVLTCAALYVAVVKLFNQSRPRPAARFTKTAAFRYFCFVHNLALSLYSGWTFLSAVPIIHRQFWRSDLQPIQRICSADQAVFHAGLGRLTYIFYLSKFYEVLDTAIILAKGKRSPLLQTYHHAGAMITMFAGGKYSATPIWLFVVFNSWVHFWMYLYYASATLKLPFPRLLKQSLTTMQITQFLVGGSSAAAFFFLKPEDASECLPNFGARLATGLCLAYLTPLTWLFVQFFINEYKRPKTDAKRAVKSAEQAVNSSLKARK